MKKHLAGLVLIGLWVLAWGHPAWADETKIGVIDTQKTLEGSKVGKKIKSSLEDYVKARQRLIESEEADLKKLQADVVQQGAAMNPEARQGKEEEFRQRVVVYQRHVQELQGEIDAKKREVLGDFSKKVEQVVTEIAAKERIFLVMEKGDSSMGTLVVFNHPSIDITDRVIKALDSKGGN